VEYLRQHYAKPLTLNELSRKQGYTPQYLSGLFHKDTGMSLQVFLQRLRVEEACRLIGEGEKRIAVIAQKVGYNDAKYFSGVFRRHKGMSLQEFRGMVV
jgi:YesN/AraC family two-component response regulator